jgi:hypothetical protein
MRHRQQILSRWAITMALISILIVFSVHAAAPHAHNDGVFHRDCAICQLGVAQHVVVSNKVAAPEYVPYMAIRLVIERETLVVQFFPKPSSARAPPRA